MSARRKVANYGEALEILTTMARAGDVRAAIALAGHLRKRDGAVDPVQAEIDELARRRATKESA
jgi:hypothetical protein